MAPGVARDADRRGRARVGAARRRVTRARGPARARRAVAGRGVAAAVAADADLVAVAEAAALAAVQGVGLCVHACPVATQGAGGAGRRARSGGAHAIHASHARRAAVRRVGRQIHAQVADACEPGAAGAHAATAHFTVAATDRSGSATVGVAHDRAAAGCSRRARAHAGRTGRACRARAPAPATVARVARRIDTRRATQDEARRAHPARPIGAHDVAVGPRRDASRVEHQPARVDRRAAERSGGSEQRQERVSKGASSVGAGPTSNDGDEHSGLHWPDARKNRVPSPSVAVET